MLYRKDGQPEIDEIVLCRVTKIFPNSVFVELVEYGKQGMVHISEVSPGRIRNLRDYVSVGRQIVCKILRIDREQGHIDLSLRRVNSHQRREKLDEIKAELKSESLVKSIAKKLGKRTEEIYRDIATKILKEYSHLYLCFQDVAEGEVKLDDIGVDKKLAKEFTDLILDKFKPEKITIEGEIILSTYDSEGVEKIKKTLKSVSKVADGITLFYLGGGRYKLIIEDEEYKPAEKNLKKIETVLEKFNDKSSKAEFIRDKD